MESENTINKIQKQPPRKQLSFRLYFNKTKFMPVSIKVSSVKMSWKTVKKECQEECQEAIFHASRFLKDVEQ